jgi:hypothetical protein
MADGIADSGTGGTTKMWVDSLPEGIKNDPGIKDFKSPEDLAKSFINLQKMLGNSIRPPGPDATPEDKKKFADDLKAKVRGVLNKKNNAAM